MRCRLTVVFFRKEKTCNLQNIWYNHETLERGVGSVFGAESGLTHIIDPCWMWVSRLTEERKPAAVPVLVSKTGAEKHRENRCCGKVKIVNLKWS